MNQATSQNKRKQLQLKSSVGDIVRLGFYVLAVFGLSVLFHSFLLNRMWLVPLFAEIVVINKAWTVGPLWRGLFARITGVIIGNALAYFFYVIPIIYAGKEPWSEETLWIYITVVVQTMVATVVLLAVRVMRKEGAH